jgi:hypothetical protein
MNDAAPTPIAAIMIISAISALPLPQESTFGLQHEETFSSDGWQQVGATPLEEQLFIL